MQLTVKLVGTLGKYLPENSENNVTEINSEDKLTVVQLIQKLDFPRTSHISFLSMMKCWLEQNVRRTFFKTPIMSKLSLR